MVMLASGWTLVHMAPAKSCIIRVSPIGIATAVVTPTPPAATITAMSSTPPAVKGL